MAGSLIYNITMQDRIFRLFLLMYLFDAVLLEPQKSLRFTGFLGFPQTVQIAVGVNCFDLVALADLEANLRFVTRVQRLPLIA